MSSISEPASVNSDEADSRSLDDLNVSSMDDTNLVEVRPPEPPNSTGGIAVLRRAERNKPAAEKKMRRILSNRRSAKASRENRRQLLKHMSSKVEDLSAGNESLAQSNTELRAQIQTLKQQSLEQANADLQAQVRYLKQLLQLQSKTKSTPASPNRRIPGWLHQGGFQPKLRKQKGLQSFQIPKAVQIEVSGVKPTGYKMYENQLTSWME